MGTEDLPVTLIFWWLHLVFCHWGHSKTVENEAEFRDGCFWGEQRVTWLYNSIVSIEMYPGSTGYIIYAASKKEQTNKQARPLQDRLTVLISWVQGFGQAEIVIEVGVHRQLLWLTVCYDDWPQFYYCWQFSKLFKMLSSKGKFTIFLFVVDMTTLM